MVDSNRIFKLTFITGAHGAGKSAICQKISLPKGIEYFKASDLIYSHLHQSHPCNKQILNLEELCSNQCALVDEVAYLKRSGHKNILLEGHTCLINRNFQIEQIPIDTFYALNISALVIVTRSTEELFETVLFRDHISYSLDVIQRLQEQEIESANQISKELSIPLLHIDTSSKKSYGFDALSKSSIQLEEFLISV